MSDPSCVLRDLASPTYGVMSHVVGVLMRAIKADGAVALCRDAVTRQETVYLNMRYKPVGPDWCDKLRQWPTDPRSGFWRTRWDHTEDRARILNPRDPDDAACCQDIVNILAMRELIGCARCLCLSLASRPSCRVLFIRMETQPPFVQQDAESLKYYAEQCGHLIQGVHRRELGHRNGGRLPLKISGEETPVEDLLDRLSCTEHRVLQRLRLHETERQAAEVLGRSPNTIHVHVKSIYRKLRVTSRRQLLSMLECVQPAEERTVA
jgi:DNA-binding CsgD family transcriptional regulator